MANMDKWSPFIYSHFLLSQPKFASGCGASRKAGSISISKNKAPLYYYRGLSGAHLEITIVFTITANV